jgi:hypothetical protein
LLNFPTQNFFIAKIEAKMKIGVRSQNSREQQGEYFTAHLPQTWMFQAGSQPTAFFFQSQKAECKRRTFIYLFVHSAGEHRHQYKCQDSISPPLDIRRMFELISGGLHPGKKQHPDITPTRRGCQLQNHATLAKSWLWWMSGKKNREIKREPPLLAMYFLCAQIYVIKKVLFTSFWERKNCWKSRSCERCPRGSTLEWLNFGDYFDN